MLRNFFTITLRHFRKNGTYSFLNIFGLATGIACAGLIFLWAENELGFDKHLGPRLYQVILNQTYDGKIYTFLDNATPGPLGPSLKSGMPGVKDECRLSWETNSLYSLNDKSLYENGYFAEPSILQMFGLRLLEGDPGTALTQPDHVIISQRMAQQFFGDEKGVVGKTLRVDNKDSYIVSGVFADLPQTSTVTFDWLGSFEVFLRQHDFLKTWNHNSLKTYVQLAPGADAAAIDRKLHTYVPQPNDTMSCFLFAPTDWHLRNHFEDGKQAGGEIEYVKMFLTVAWIVLLIACINFMNLATARSEKRAREVGVRKVLGALRGNLLSQFMGEALFLSSLSTALGAVLITLLLPYFNDLIGGQISARLFDPLHLGALVGIALVCGVVAGSYPSLYLSSFNPIFVFKGIKRKGGAASLLRKGLVVFQFSISIALIIATILIYQQVQHVRNRELGLRKDHLIQIFLVGNIRSHFNVIRQDLLNTGLVENAALGDMPLFQSGNNTSGFSWQGKDPTRNTLISVREVSPEFLKTIGVHIREGRDFDANADLDSTQMIITKSLADLMGKGSAVGKTITSDNVHETYTVRAVVDNYVYGDMYGTSDPVVFQALPQYTSNLFVRTKAESQPEEVLARVESVFKKDNPGYPFTYQFVDQQFDELFRAESLISRLSRLFAALAVFISCLGLFGLASFTAERRTKEIGIRKVLGASAASLAALLSGDFLRLVFLSALISFPVAWWAMHNWLQGYAYRISISGWVFVGAGVAAVLIALATISFQAIRAALTNPVKSLRTE